MAHLTLHIFNYYSDMTQARSSQLADYLAKRLDGLRPEEAIEGARELVKKQRLG
jgi:hypothetical protein